MFRIRNYHTKNRFLRLLDYAEVPGSPSMRSPLNNDYLLRSKANLRYGSQDSKLEQATVLAAYFENFKHKNIKGLEKTLQKRLNIADLLKEEVAWQSGELSPAMRQLIEDSEVSHDDIKALLDCFFAPTLTEALEVMKGRRWPSFLVIYTLNREVHSQIEAYHAIKLYLSTIEQAKSDFQVEMTSLALRIAQDHIVEMAPPICEIFSTYGSVEAKSPAALNELLWVLAKFGTTWTKSESLVLIAAQEILVKSMGRVNLDMKGRVGLAYTVLPSSRKTALNLVNLEHDKTDGFVYHVGRQMIEIMAAQSAEEILAGLNSVEPEHRTSRVWSIVLLSLRNQGLLNSALAKRLWGHLKNTKVRFSQQMAELLLVPLQTISEKITHFKFLEQSGIKVNTGILSAFFHVSSRHELSLATTLVSSFGDMANDPSVLTARIAAEAKHNKKAVWNTYQEILKQTAPSADVLESLCVAAWVRLKWDDALAVQRTIPEIHKWVRRESDDIFRLYPTQRLLYAYVFMLGKARYDVELLEVLPWLENLNFSPEKRTLCALIHYSSHGQALLKLGAKAEGEWPTPGELEEYAHGLSKTSASN
ncbi:hypothetical protein B9G98_00845 [Wickerhamiella sorbophila]|uniref:Uncharacterized protein n=1 Tax=Wickerhamiella sorbophila TaxID=45607 RepID=A0A2T0FE32_9ASCO|nr:hypothetical protein B9G98_00845 [Wickerhamiella sorbophila]PRT53225.1 hypothetical protein B9G98_00845 [Wickerhamiella sorbophila]